MNRFTRTLSIASASLFASQLYAADGMPLLDGSWNSIACELRPQAGQDGVQPWHLKRNIAFSGNRIDAHFTTYADSKCSSPLLDLKFGGEVRVQGSSDVAPGAMEVDLVVNDYLRITPLAEAFTGFLNSAEAGACGAESWKVGGEQDVFGTGCSLMGIAANSPTNEFEVLYVAGGQLYFGARPVNGMSLDSPDARPKALQVPLQLGAGGITRQVGSGDARVPQVVETVMFEQQDDADPEAVREFFESITVKMNQNDTLLYRTVAQADGGKWLCVNYWLSREAMETLNAQAQEWTDDFAAMGELAKMDTFVLESYSISGD